jgi:hypothetical protein
MKGQRAIVVALFWVLSLVAAAGAQTTATAPATTRAASGPADLLRQRIARLVNELESDDFDAREKATLALIEIGPEVLEILYQRLPDGTAELRQRATHIAAEISRKWQGIRLDAGKVVAGFQAFLLPPPKVYAAGDKIHLHVVLSNVGPTSRQIVDFRGFDLELPDHKLEFTSRRSDGRLIVRKAGRTATPREGKAIEYPAIPDQRINFAGGGSIATLIPLHAAVALPAGEYEVQFVWYSATKSLVADAMEDLKSNPVRVKVGQ